jgi:hypothetical protein
LTELLIQGPVGRRRVGAVPAFLRARARNTM